jgi:hypothetical protein
MGSAQPEGGTTVKKIGCVLLALFLVSPVLVGAEAQLHPVLRVLEWSTDWNHVDITISNPSEEEQDGWLCIWFIMNGESLGWAIPVSVPPESDLHLRIGFTGTVQVLEAAVYVDGYPDHITEAPDPIIDAIEEHTEPHRPD